MTKYHVQGGIELPKLECKRIDDGSDFAYTYRDLSAARGCLRVGGWAMELCPRASGAWQRGDRLALFHSRGIPSPLGRRLFSQPSLQEPTIRVASQPLLACAIELRSLANGRPVVGCAHYLGRPCLDEPRGLFETGVAGGADDPSLTDDLPLAAPATSVS